MDFTQVYVNFVNFKNLATIKTLRKMTETTIKLKAPEINEGITVKEALAKRSSSREFAGTPLTLKELSEILWAAYGINRPDGHRTVPAAWGIYGLNLYAVLDDGIYLYNPEDHTLELVTAGDHRHCCGMQEFVYTAPLNLVWMADYSRMHIDDTTFEPMLQEMLPVITALDSGAGCENVYLYAASAGLNIVERVLIDEDSFKKAASLDDNMHFVVAQTIGHRP